MTVNVYHKHSEVRDDSPPPEMLERGEIALCTNQDSAHLFIKDTANAVRLIGGDWWPTIDDLRIRLGQLEEIVAGIPNPEKVLKLLKELASIEVELEKLHRIDKLQTDQIKKLDGWVKDLQGNIKEQWVWNEAREGEIVALQGNVQDQWKWNEAREGEIVALQGNIQDQWKWNEVIEPRVDQNEANIKNHWKKIKANEDRIVKLETLDVDAVVDEGITVERTDEYKFHIGIDQDWLEQKIQTEIVAFIADPRFQEELKKYALKDFGTNTDELS